MSLKKFNAQMVQTLNGVDTYSFDVVCSSASLKTRLSEGATIAVKVGDILAFSGSIKSTSDRNAGFIRNVVSESPLSITRDTDVSEESARGLTRLSTLVASLLPPGFTVTIVASENPPIEYAFRSGSILTHLNTLCAMSAMNWRAAVLSPTSAAVELSDYGSYTQTIPEYIENKDVFNLKIDRSLFKHYTQVTVVGVEPEVSGYTVVASLNPVHLEGATYPATYFVLDSDDGEIDREEVLLPGYTYGYLSPSARYKRLDLRYGAELKGWDQNTVCYVNGEFVQYGYKSGASLFEVERGAWGSAALGSHTYNDPCVLVNRLYLKTAPAALSPATTLFKIGSEIIKGNLSSNVIELATVDPDSLIYSGRGLEYVEDVGMMCNPVNVYSHKRGSVVVPYYPNADDVTKTASYLAITIHGKGIVTKDGLDRLAWGVLRNVQNGIMSGSAVFKSADFFDSNINVGQQIKITTASTRTGTSNIISPATTYDCLIYSITRKQNALMQIEFGNVIPEILTMIKSGEYALQAALRKTKDSTIQNLDGISVTGYTGTFSGSRIAKLRW